MVVPLPTKFSFPMATFSFWSADFPELRFDHPRAVRRVVEATRGREFNETFSPFIGLVSIILSGEKGLSTSSIGTTGVFEQTGRSRRTGMAAVDFDVLFTWEWSFDVFVVTEDLEIRLAG